MLVDKEVLRLVCWTLPGQMTYIWGQQFDPPFFPLLRHNRPLLTGLCCAESEHIPGPEWCEVEKLEVNIHSWVWRMQFCVEKIIIYQTEEGLRLWFSGSSVPQLPPWSEILSEDPQTRYSRVCPGCPSLIFLSFLSPPSSALDCPYLVATIALLERCRNIDTIHSPPPTPPQPPPH